MERINRLIVTIALFIGTLVLVRLSYSMRMPVIGLLIPIAFIAFSLIGRPGLLFVIAVGTQESRIVLPGFPDALGVSQMMQMLLIVWAILDIAIRKPLLPGAFRPKVDGWLILFGLNIVLVMSMRGFGLRIQGEGEYGGSTYILLLMIIVFYFCSTRLTLNDAQIRSLLWIVLLGASIPMIAEITAYFSAEGGEILRKYISIRTGYVMREQRWNYMSFVAYALVAISYVLVKSQMVRALLLTVAFVMVGFGGFRTRLIRVAMLTLMASVQYSRHRPRTITRWAGLAIVGYMLLIVFVRILPDPVQRAVSFVPMVQVEENIARKAEGSTTWRLDLWKNYCIPAVPKYLLVGRGISRDIMEFAWLRSEWYESDEFFFHMGAYHSGIFDLLLNWGLIGLISFTGFFYCIARDAWRVIKKYPGQREALTFKYFSFMTIVISFELFNFFALFGSMPTSLPRMLFVAAQLRIIQRQLLGSDPGAMSNQ